MPMGSETKKNWDKMIPTGFVSLSAAARIIGRDFSVVRKYAIKLGVIETRGKGQPALIKTSDLEGLKEVMKEVPTGIGHRRATPEPEPEPKPGVPKWAEPVLLAPSPEKEFEQAVRKVLHLMERLGIDSITMQDGKAEMLRTVSVTKKEEIKG